MTFRPDPNDSIQIADTAFHVGEHPAAPGMPYGQEGRAAVVYQLIGAESIHAFKVFKPRFRVPSLVALTARLAGFAATPGLTVCRRTVLTPQQHGTLLRTQPDLVYSMLMPWIEGPTWMEVLLDQRELSPEQSIQIARSMARVLAEMERNGLAHCDISGPNVLLPVLASPRSGGSQFAIELVDVEQMYGPGLNHPEVLPQGSQGYAHRSAEEGLWFAQADRFAGAVIIAEMLGMCDRRVREASWGENYFDPDEMQMPSERYTLLQAAISEQWGPHLAALLNRAWNSATLESAPTMTEWETVLSNPEAVPPTVSKEIPAAAIIPVEPDTQPVQRVESLVQMLVDYGESLQAAGDRAGALLTYREASSITAEDEPIYAVLAQRITALEGNQVPNPEQEPAQSNQQASAVPTYANVPQVPAPRPQAGLPAAPAIQPQPQLVAQYPPPAQKPQQAPYVDQHAAYFDRLYDQSSAAYKAGDLGIAAQLLRELVRQQPGYRRGGHLATSLLLEVDEKLRASEQVRGKRGAASRMASPSRGGNRGVIIAVVIAMLVLVTIGLYVVSVVLKPRPASFLSHTYASMSGKPETDRYPQFLFQAPGKSSLSGEAAAHPSHTELPVARRVAAGYFLLPFAGMASPSLVYSYHTLAQNKHALEIA